MNERLKITLYGYEFDVVDSLLKPVLSDRFLKAVQKVIRQKPAEETEAKKESVLHHITALEVNQVQIRKNHVADR